MSAVSCPTLSDVLASNECMENFAGLGATVYVGVKSDLTDELVLTDNVYAAPSTGSGESAVTNDWSSIFASGKGLYKFDCKEDSQQIQGSSLGRRKGFKLTANFILEAVNKASSKVARALNNLDIFIIMKDGDDSQILYDPERRITFDSDGISSDTGASADDDRQMTLAATLSPVKYPNLYVTEPTDGWDSLLASAAASE